MKTIKLKDIPNTKMHSIALELLRKIEEEGFTAYLVGGYPRDLYRKRKSMDIDVCTNATPQEIQQIFKTGNLENRQYGSIKIIYKTIPFEITTFRKDKNYKNYRQPEKVIYVNSVEKDLERRDFTMNTLLMNKENEIIDYLDGIKDITEKKVKMVGNPKIRLKEDALRILRAIRFATTLDFDLDPSLRKYIEKYGYLLENLSFYRKKEELNKIFTSPNALKGIHLLQELHLEEHLSLYPKKEIVYTSSPLGIWAQFHVKEYPFTNQEKKQIELIEFYLKNDITKPFSLYQAGLTISILVGEILGMNKQEITKKYEKLPIHTRKEICLSPLEIHSLLGQKQTILYKEIYKNLEYQIVENKIKNTPEEVKKYIKEIVKEID